MAQTDKTEAGSFLLSIDPLGNIYANNLIATD